MATQASSPLVSRRCPAGERARPTGAGWRWLLASIVFALALPIAALAHETPFADRGGDLQDELRQARATGQGLAVLFEQDDCPACARLRRDVLAQPAAPAALRGWRTLTLGLADGTTVVAPRGGAEPALDFANRLGVFGTPALVFFDRDGGPIYRHLGGLRDARDLALLTRFVAARRFERQPFADYLRQARRPKPQAG